MTGNIRKRIYTCSSQEHNGELVGFKSLETIAQTRAVSKHKTLEDQGYTDPL
jgi:hypothetical protein